MKLSWFSEQIFLDNYMYNNTPKQQLSHIVMSIITKLREQFCLSIFRSWREEAANENIPCSYFWQVMFNLMEGFRQTIFNPLYLQFEFIFTFDLINVS